MPTEVEAQRMHGRTSATPGMARRAPVVLGVAAALLAASAATFPAFAAGGRSRAATIAWAPAATATVHPGVMTFTSSKYGTGFFSQGSSQCTANFVFTDGTTVYLGQAAHCSSTGTDTQTSGCTTPSLPLGTRVAVGGDPELSPLVKSYTGTLVYNSWLAMQAAKETNSDACQYNDFALIQLPTDGAADTNPSVPILGGPTGLGTTASLGDTVYSYGNSMLRAGVKPLSPKAGVTLGSSARGWTQSVYTASPGVPGDSGSGFMNGTGQAIGVLSTVELAPCTASNGVGSLSLELNWMHSHGYFTGVQLAPGTQPFVGAALPLDTNGSSIGC